MTEVKERMKVQIREEWLMKDVFSCKKCGASNEHIKWNDEGSDHPALQPEGVLFCEKCIHELTEKKELEDLVYFVEQITYSFYLRFAKEWFTPCQTCQETIDGLFNTAKMIKFSREKSPSLIKVIDKSIHDCGDGRILLAEKKGVGEIYYFNMEFLRRATPTRTESLTYVPCKDCQKGFVRILGNCELIIGNKDYYDPPIEFNRKWKTDDKRTQQLEKLMKQARNVGIHKNSFLANVRNKATTEKFDEFIRNTTKQVGLMKELTIQERHEKWLESLRIK